ncbi:MAG: hypothetical protein ACFB0C_00425 [Leptolyngbyaceae cyanobacterium]
MLSNTRPAEGDRGDRLFDSPDAKDNIWLATDYDELQHKDGDRFDDDEFTDLQTAINNAIKWSIASGEPLYVWHWPHKEPQGRFPLLITIQDRIYLTPGHLVAMEQCESNSEDRYTDNPTNANRSAMPWVLTDNGETTMEPGLTKLEWFAGMAMKGLLANPACGQTFPKYEEVSALAMAQAADMLATLRGETGQPDT